MLKVLRKYRCSFRTDEQGLPAVVIEAADPYLAAVKAANKRREKNFDAVEVWEGATRLLTWLRPTDDPTWFK